jgi:micrococcal nuclease
VYLDGYRPRRPGRAAALLAAAVLWLGAGSAAAVELRATVERVVDGDTIRVRIGREVHRVRYIGVNAPELRHPTRGLEAGARDATDVNRRLLGDGPIRLDLDVRTRDRSGRLLAYVYAGGVMVNAELVRRGYAQVMTVPPNVKHERLFRDLEREARAAGRGLWGTRASQPPPGGPAAEAYNPEQRRAPAAVVRDTARDPLAGGAP